MRKPELIKCPVCSVELRTEDRTPYGGPKGVPKTVKPECADSPPTDKPDIRYLGWRCLVCGAWWRHGIYSSEA